MVRRCANWSTSGPEANILGAPTRRSSRIRDTEVEKVQAGWVAKTKASDRKSTLKEGLKKQPAKKSSAKAETTKKLAAEEEIAKEDPVKKTTTKSAAKEVVEAPAAKKLTRKALTKTAARKPASKKETKISAAQELRRTGNPARNKAGSDSSSAEGYFIPGKPASPEKMYNGKSKSPKKSSKEGQGGFAGQSIYNRPTKEQLKNRARQLERHPGTIFCG